MSGGKDQKTSTTTTSVPDWAVPYAQQYMQQGAQIGQQEWKPYEGDRYVNQNEMQTSAIQQQANQARGGSTVNNAASNNLTGTLNGDYLNEGSNPYLTAQINKAQGDVARNYNDVQRPRQDQMAARSGSFGNSGVAQSNANDDRMVAETMGNISTQMRGQEYGNERNRQMQAAGMAPGASQAGYNDSQQLFNAGTAANQPAQQDADFQYQQYTDQQNDPYRRLTATGAPFGANLGSTVSEPAGSRTAGAIGGGMAGASMGSNFGNWGTAIGGGLGAIGGGK